MPYQQPYQPMNPYQNFNYPYSWGGVTPAPQYGASQQPAQYTPQSQPVQQPQQPQQQRKPLVGHYVASDSEILPSDIPMDGSMGIFPAQDGSCIYVRQIGGDFKMHQTKFVPEKAEPEASAPDIQSVMNGFDKRLAAIENALRPRQASHMRQEASND